jgi:hypothetical protein
MNSSMRTIGADGLTETHHPAAARRRHPMHAGDSDLGDPGKVELEGRAVAATEQVRVITFI